MEVGLGGRLDATNVITPEISVITSLSLDHTALLGNTLAEIAYEKGGIIKPGVPVVSAPQQPEALNKLKEIALERESPIHVVSEDMHIGGIKREFPYQVFKIKARTGSNAFDGEYKLSLLGDFQVENAATTITAAKTLYETGHTWASPEAVRYSLENVTWAGRMEVLRTSPPVVIDSAHNPYSTGVLIQSLKSWFPETKWLLIYGASGDKDIKGMLSYLLPEVEHVIVTRSYHPRAACPYELADLCADQGKGAEIAVSAERALDQACEHLNKHQWGLIVTGSVFLVADVREAWSTLAEQKLDIPQGDWVDEPW
jgi:dihydrofolate synthase/folylpolyglutamate synthase